MKYFCLICTMCFWLTTSSQKHGNLWCVHIAPFSTIGININFNHPTPVLEIVDREMQLVTTNSSVCDEDGNLLAYTNGVWIANSTNQMMENGDSINYPYYTSTGTGYQVPQGAFFLPRPGHETQYYLFHMRYGWQPGQPMVIPYFLYCSLLDFSYNGGLGKVVEKNVPLLTGDGYVNFHQATAVRHANGRDWWIMVPRNKYPLYYRLLLTPEGIEGPWIQDIGDEMPAYARGQGIFSPDGTKYAFYDFVHGVRIFDFDRCSGLLSNLRVIPPWFDGNPVQGIAFSPSGRFLYVTRLFANGTDLTQYDLLSPDVAASGQVIHFCPNPPSHICWFNSLLLGPNGKIYISGVEYTAFHIVHEPDSLGQGCVFEYGGLVFPLSHPSGSFPYYPEYRLGALEDSPCDTIGLTRAREVAGAGGAKLSVFPNPASGPATLQYHVPGMDKGEAIVFDGFGRSVVTIKLQQEAGQLPLPDLAPGVYLIRLSASGQHLSTVKFIQF